MPERVIRKRYLGKKKRRKVYLLLCKYHEPLRQNTVPSSPPVHEDQSRAVMTSIAVHSKGIRTLLRKRIHTFREWIRRIDTRASGPGGGNSILRSIRPGRSRAESKMSMTCG